MQRHFEKELESLKTNLIKMGSIVEEAIGLAIRALMNHDSALAQNVIEGDERVNALEMEVDNAIVDLLALQQPVASDLRLILAAQKINNDLERLGDHAVNIAESAHTLAKAGMDEPLLDLPKMAEIAQTMLRTALDAFIHRDASLGKAVLAQDNIIDDLNRDMTQQVVELLKGNKRTIDTGLDLIRISRNLERIADLATNIAEEVIFVAEARVVKHHADEANQKEKT